MLPETIQMKSQVEIVRCGEEIRPGCTTEVAAMWCCIQLLAMENPWDFRESTVSN